MVLNTTERDLIQSNAIAWCVLIPFIAVENVLCLLAVSSRKRWKSPDVLLFSFILAHFITLTVPFLMYTMVMLLRGRSWTPSTCKFLVWCIMSLRIINSLQIAYLSMDRVWTLKWPSSYRIHNSAKQSARTAMFIWIFSLAIGTIPMLGWPPQDGSFEHCSMILKVAGYGFAMCIVVIILGSFLISSTCIITILINVLLKNEILEGHLEEDSRKQIPEIVIESETGETKTESEHKPVTRIRQNKQICILVAAVVITFYTIGDLPFVIINIIALMTPTNPAWMPVVLMWSAMIATFLHPILFAALSVRYRKGYGQLFLGVGIGCGCLDSQQKQNELQREDTIDSLDVFENDEDDDKISYPVADPAGFGFTQSMELDDPPKYEITPSIEGTRTSSAIVVRFQQSREIKRGLEFDNIGYKDEDDKDYEKDDRRDEIDREKIKGKEQPRLSSKERRAQFQALKVSKPGHAKEKEKPKPTRDNQSRNRHRKVERLSKLSDSKSRDKPRDKPRDNVMSKTVIRQERVRTIHVEVENEDIMLTVNSDNSPGGQQLINDKPRSKSKSQSDVKKSKHKRQDKRKDGESGSKKTTSSKSERSGTSRSNGPTCNADSALRNSSSRFDSIREKMLLEMSSVGSAELYDIPEDPAEDSMDSFSNPLVDSSLTSETDVQISGESLRLEELNVGKLNMSDSQETIPIGFTNGDEHENGRKRLNFQFSLPESPPEGDFSFPILGSIDTGNEVPMASSVESDNTDKLTNGCDFPPDSTVSEMQVNSVYQSIKPEHIYSLGSEFSDSTSSKSSAKEMREMFKNSKTGNALVNTLQTDASGQQEIVYL